MRSRSNTLSFKFVVQVAFKFYFTQSQYQPPLEILDWSTFSGFSSGSVTKEYTFPLNISGHSTWVVKAAVHEEAEIEVP